MAQLFSHGPTSIQGAAGRDVPRSARTLAGAGGRRKCTHPPADSSGSALNFAPNYGTLEANLTYE
jgi:hypothetical protein